jgi:signal transduction histidine kinase
MRDGDSSTHQPSGSGMGLAIAKGIVEAHGGRIWIEEPQDNRGNCVVITLPIGDEGDTSPEAGGLKNEPTENQLNGETYSV